jgi:hypothetical protein
VPSPARSAVVTRPGKKSREIRMSDLLPNGRGSEQGQSPYSIGLGAMFLQHEGTSRAGRACLRALGPEAENSNSRLLALQCHP